MGWSLLATPAGTQYESSINADGSVILLTVGNKIHKSINGGLSWSELFHDPGVDRLRGVEQTPDGQYIVAVGSVDTVPGNCRVWYSDDYGASFSSVGPGFTDKPWESCAISDDGLVIGITARSVSPTQGYFFWSTNAGSSWSNRGYGSISGNYYCAVSGDGTTLFHAQFNGIRWGYAWSTNLGSSWDTWFDSSGLLGTTEGLAVSEDGQVLVAGFGGTDTGTPHMRISTNGGTSWSGIVGPTVNGRYGAVELSADGQTIVVAQNHATPGMWRSLDQGSSWSGLSWSGQLREEGVELNSTAELLIAITATNSAYSNELPIPLDLFVADINAQSTNISLGFVPPLLVGEIDAQSSLRAIRLGSVLSDPVIVNRAPAPGEEKGVLESIRFSVRDEDRQVRRTSLQCYLGYGSAWWGGGVLPDDDPLTTFILRSRVGAPSAPADRELDGDELVLTKSLAGLQESIYEFGGLQAPANFDAPLMFEFEVGLDSYSVDGQYWTGVFAGFKAYNKGVAVKFVDDGNKKIELHSADPASATPIYSVIYDWSVGVHIFKLLWYPENDLMRLYASSGPTATAADVVLIHGAASAFPDLPSDEIPDVQPQGFFGHGGFSSTSVSRWASVYLYNAVTQAIVDGIPRGNHDGNFLSDSPHLYAASDFPRKVTRPWIVLPDSFGAIGGEEILEADGRISLLRSDSSKSFGFYRVEPKAALGPTIVDFKLWGRIASRPPGLGPESGIEVYVDDGTKKAVVEFLDTGDTQSVGIRGGSSNLSGWGAPKLYRLIVDPTGAARIMALGDNDDGVVEEEFTGLNYASLPASDLPGPGIGFLHNANTVLATGELNLSWIRYSLDARMWEGSSGLPLAPWSLFGTGTPTLANDIVTIVDDNEGEGSDNLGYERAETQSENKGLFIEAICAVDSYSKNGVENPTRAVTGVGLAIDDDLVQYELLFADGGPELGKIAFLTTGTDRDQNLIDIRAQRSEVLGTYFAIDWTKFHHYRLERNIGGDILVYVDWETLPRIQILASSFEAPASTSEGVRFGSLLTDRKTTSRWQSVRYGISYGWDVEALPKVDELRYDNAINALVEVDS